MAAPLADPVPGPSPSDSLPASPVPVESLPLDDIVLDGGTQVRAAIDDEVVSSYVELIRDGYSFPPVVVYSDRTARYMSDGFHRHHAYRLAGRTRIDAEVRSGTLEDALWYALGANRGRGLQMTRADKRHAVELALKTWPDRSQNQIARQVGCSQQYVSRVRAQVTTSCDLPDRVVGADGKSYPAARSTPPSNDSTAAPSPAAAHAAASSVASASPSPGTDSPAASMPTMPVPRSLPAGSPARPVVVAGALGAASGDDVDLDAGASPASSAVSAVADPAAADSSPAPAPPPPGLARARIRSDRIMSAVVLDAQGLTSQQHLVDFSSLTRERLREWRDGLREAVRGVNDIIRSLDKELGDGPETAA